MAGETEDEIPESGAIFTFGKSKFADNVPSRFWLKNDRPLRISCGDEHTALITENGKLFMFGSNNWGQLGLGTKATVNKPTCVKALKSEKVKLAACGRNHTIIYTTQGNVYAAGGNNEGQLGLGNSEERNYFELVDFFRKHGPIKMLAAGSNTSAALTDGGTLYVWGDNSEGQIGLGKESNALSPQELSVGKSVSWISCGYYHSALVTMDGALYTFGEKDSGKLGLHTNKLANHRVPQLVEGITGKVLQVACGGGHTVALTEDKLYTFGLGQFGQLGHGTFVFEAWLPRDVEYFRKGLVRHVECGENHTAVITDSGLLYTFGDGRHGKLGLGEENFTNQFKPTLCFRFLKHHVESVTCGGCHMLVLAKPRAKGSEEVTLEEEDVTEDIWEKPYSELMSDTTSSAILTTMNRSLSARVRRRERERSSEQFGLMFRTLPPLTGSYLCTSQTVPSQTMPASMPSGDSPPNLDQSGIHNRHKRRSYRKGKGAKEHVPEKKSSAVEDFDDIDSVKGLGETTDLLNVTHVMSMDPADNTLTLSPVQKKVKVVRSHGKTLLKEHVLPEGKADSKAKRALPTELLKSASSKSLLSESSSGTASQMRGRGKENVLLTVEEPGQRRTGITSSKGKHAVGSPSMDHISKRESRPLSPPHTKPTEGKRHVMKAEGRDKPEHSKPKAHVSTTVSEVHSPTQAKLSKGKDQVENQGKGETMSLQHKVTSLTIKEALTPVKTKGKLGKAQLSPAKLKSEPITVQSKSRDDKEAPTRKKTKGHHPSLKKEQEYLVSRQKIFSPANDASLKTKKHGTPDIKEPIMVSEATTDREQGSDPSFGSTLSGVASFVRDMGTESPVSLVKGIAASHFDSYDDSYWPTSENKSRAVRSASRSALSDAMCSDSSESETQEPAQRRTAVTINVMPEPGSSDQETEKGKGSLHSHDEDGEGEQGDESRDMTAGEESEDETKKRGLTSDEEELQTQGTSEGEVKMAREEREEKDDDSKTLNDISDEEEDDTTLKEMPDGQDSSAEKSESASEQEMEGEAEEEEEDEVGEMEEESGHDEKDEGQEEEQHDEDNEDGDGNTEVESKTNEGTEESESEKESEKEEDDYEQGEESEGEREGLDLAEDEDESEVDEEGGRVSGAEDEEGEEEEEDNNENEEVESEEEDSTGDDGKGKEEDESEESETDEGNELQEAEEEESEAESKGKEDEIDEEEEASQDKEEGETEAVDEEDEEDEQEEDNKQPEEEEEEGEEGEESQDEETEKDDEDEESEAEELEGIAEEEGEESGEEEEEGEESGEEEEEGEEEEDEAEGEEEEDEAEGEEEEDEAEGEEEEDEEEDEEEEDEEEDKEEGEEEEDEEEGEEEEEEIKNEEKKKTAKSTKPKPVSRQVKGRAKSSQSPAKSQSEEEQFWDDVLPQYLNLK
ncbi:retinitis pigmentosa GTPase regulator b isoform X2 [Denticeps clupeoides]|uniref:retinitis pigmentosa GTPase regulator b isoform X2 n=1 Tax=Denticeps clupeoides TaxID=299321 RepID=UPI0010A51709|nr:nestin-like isoform X2 [Denticeps clupeoides]